MEKSSTLSNYELAVSKQGLQQIYVLPKFPTLESQNYCYENWETNREVNLEVITINSESKCVAGFVGKVCLKSLTPSSSKPGRNSTKILTLVDVRKCLFEEDGCGFKIVTEGSKSHQKTCIALSNKGDEVGSVALESTTLEETLRILATVTLTLPAQLAKNAWELKFRENEEKLRTAETNLRNLTIEKNRNLDYMYRAFHKCIKTKKTRICELKSKLDIGPSSSTRKLKASPKKPNRRIESDSETGSDIEAFASKEKHSHSDTDFSEDSRDTDVEILEEKNTKSPKKMTGNESKVLPQHSQPDSQNELSPSLPEFKVNRKLRSTGNQLKLNAKSGQADKRSAKDEEFAEDTKNASDNLKSPRKQSKIEEAEDLDEMYDCDKLMDQI